MYDIKKTVDEYGITEYTSIVDKNGIKYLCILRGYNNVLILFFPRLILNFPPIGIDLWAAFVYNNN